jgi:serine/threonine protein phosphatase PrpC
VDTPADQIPRSSVRSSAPRDQAAAATQRLVVTAMESETVGCTSGVRTRHARYDVATATRTGLRCANADATLVDDDAGLFAIGDGMGDTLAAGLVAKMALEAVRELFLEPWSSVPPDQRSAIEASTRLSLGVLQAHRRINAPSRARAERIGTTFAGVVACGSSLCVGHVGDSRVYILRRRTGTLTQLTVDDTVLSEAIREGTPPHEAATLPDAHKLTRVLGVRQRVDLRPSIWPWESGDIAMLCTDGVSDQVRGGAIAAILFGAVDLRTAAHQLVDVATAGVGLDNSTVVLLRAAG